jgi:hypothetical protein
MSVKTLQKIVYTDTQFLTYLLKKTKDSIEDYESFCSKQIDTEQAIFIDTTWENMSIDLLPYLFTISRITDGEFQQFLTLCWQYTLFSEIDGLCIRNYLIKFGENSERVISEDFFNFIKDDKLLMIAMLYIMQYYFI